MKTSVKLFAGARDMIGTSEVLVDLKEKSTVGDLRRILCTEYPALAALVARSMFAVDACYANDDQVISRDMEVACIPPVSGG